MSVPLALLLQFTLTVLALIIGTAVGRASGRRLSDSRLRLNEFPDGLVLPVVDDPRWSRHANVYGDRPYLAIAKVRVYANCEVMCGGVLIVDPRAKKYAEAVRHEYAKRKALEAIES